MADEKTEQTPETEADAAPEAAAEETAAPEAAAPAAPAGPSRRDRLEARRAERRPGQRGQVTPEQREEERKARRAATAKQRRAYRAKLKERRASEQKTKPAVEEQHAAEHGPGRPRVRQGVVTSAKGDKTITVKIDVVRRHRRYHKILRSTLKLYAHDEAN